jgi:hypothetical protein
MRESLHFRRSGLFGRTAIYDFISRNLHLDPTPGPTRGTAGQLHKVVLLEGFSCPRGGRWSCPSRWPCGRGSSAGWAALLFTMSNSQIEKTRLHEVARFTSDARERHVILPHCEFNIKSDMHLLFFQATTIRRRSDASSWPTQTFRGALRAPQAYRLRLGRTGVGWAKSPAVT